MIEQTCYFDSVLLEAKLLAKCLISNDSKITIKSAIALRSSAKTYRCIIDRDPFFREIVYSIDPSHPFFSLSPQEATAHKQLSFGKEKIFKLREFFIIKNEMFSGTMNGEALVHSDGVELVSFSEGIKSFKLNENASVNSIIIPEHLSVPHNQFSREYSFVARSRKYFAVNDRVDSAVYVYTADGKECLQKYEVDGVIVQIAIQENLLCVVENYFGKSTMSVFDLELSEEQNGLRICLPNDCALFEHAPICFGKEYLIYASNGWHRTEWYPKQIYAFPLAGLHKRNEENLSSLWQQVNSAEGVNYLFPNGNDFIEVVMTNKDVFEVAKITHVNNCLHRELIVKNIVISEVCSKDIICDVCFFDDRVFIAYMNGETKIFCYDLKLRVVNLLQMMKINSAFHSRFLTVAQFVYFVIMGLKMNVNGVERVKSHLTTLKYGKI